MTRLQLRTRVVNFDCMCVAIGRIGGQLASTLTEAIDCIENLPN